jgi:hypothetical protein
MFIFKKRNEYNILIMEKLLFLLAVVCVVLAISSHHKMHKNMEGEESSKNINESLTGSDTNPESLSYALTKMTGPQVKFAPAPITQPPAPSPTKTQTPAPPMSKDDLVKVVNKLVQEIQLNNEDSAFALDKALSLTSAKEDMALKLTVLQAAMSIQGDNLTVRNLAIREATSIVVPENFNTDNPTPEEVAQRDMERNIVTTSFKVYIQSSQDMETTYNDTVQVLNFQTDPWIRRQIIFESVSRFPQLRERLNEQ